MQYDNSVDLCVVSQFALAETKLGRPFHVAVCKQYERSIEMADHHCFATGSDDYHWRETRAIQTGFRGLGHEDMILLLLCDTKVHILSKMTQNRCRLSTFKCVGKD